MANESIFLLGVMCGLATGAGMMLVLASYLDRTANRMRKKRVKSDTYHLALSREVNKTDAK